MSLEGSKGRKMEGLEGYKLILLANDVKDHIASACEFGLFAAAWLSIHFPVLLTLGAIFSALRIDMCDVRCQRRMPCRSKSQFRTGICQDRINELLGGTVAHGHTRQRTLF